MLSVFSISSCSGGGGGSSPSGNGDGPGSQNNGCSQEYYQTMIGSYTGQIELNTIALNPRMCQWAATVIVTGESVLTRCNLRATTTATVDQLSFFPDDTVDRYQCIEDNGERTIREPIGSTFPISEFPGLDNSQFPVDIEFSKNILPSRGPYFGGENTNAAYAYLFDGSLANIVEQITVQGDGTFTLRDTNGVLLGTLVKEQ